MPDQPILLLHMYTVGCEQQNSLPWMQKYLNKNSVLCNLHFEQNQFNYKNRDSLVWNAIPNIV